MHTIDITVEVCGMAGDGTIAAGGMLNEAMSRGGFSVLGFDSYPAEIRGFGRCVTRSRFGTEEILAKALHKYGDKDMALDYLNCGNAALDAAARDCRSPSARTWCRAWRPSRGWERDCWARAS